MALMTASTAGRDQTTSRLQHRCGSSQQGESSAEILCCRRKRSNRWTMCPEPAQTGSAPTKQSDYGDCSLREEERVTTGNIVPPPRFHRCFLYVRDVKRSAGRHLKSARETHVGGKKTEETPVFSDRSSVPIDTATSFGHTLHDSGNVGKIGAALATWP